MKIHSKTTLAILVVAASTGLFGNPAFSHSFNVALVLPGSPATSAQARQIREGFLLATTERDGHPDEESDGHLGGLDVYVRQATTPASLDADIVVLLGSENSTTQFSQKVDQNNTALLHPGKNPFANTESSSVSNFITTYTKAYGSAPTASAAQGYNAARRIEIAVRQQGAADDKNSLTASFKQTATGFNW